MNRSQRRGARTKRRAKDRKDRPTGGDLRGEDRAVLARMRLADRRGEDFADADLVWLEGHLVFRDWLSDEQLSRATTFEEGRVLGAFWGREFADRAEYEVARARAEQVRQTVRNRRQAFLDTKGGG